MELKYFLKDDLRVDKAALIVSTFRFEVFNMYRCVLEELSKESNSYITVLTSEEFFKNKEYGDFQISEKQKRKQWSSLKKISKKIKLKICDGNVLNIPANIEVGILSSLVSETRDEYATKEKYPQLYEIYNNLALGAAKICDQIEDYNIVYVFNGRVASVRPIIGSLRKLKKHIRYLEWSYSDIIPVPNDGHGIVLPFSPHDGIKFCNLIEDHFEKCDFYSSTQKISLGYAYLSGKFQNTFSKNYAKKGPIYSTVYFLSSNDEFSSLEPNSDFINKQIENIDIIARNNLGIKDICVRAHPNSSSANKTFDSLVKAKCDIYGFDFISGFDPVDSYDLILKSNKIYIDSSSIGIEVVGLGKRLYYFGQPFYSGLIGKSLNIDNSEDKYPCSDSESLGLIKVGFFMKTYFWYKKPSFKNHKKHFIKKYLVLISRIIIWPINKIISW